jgi:hypothetical protein
MLELFPSFDSINPLARLKLSAELASVLKELEGLDDSPLRALKRLSLASKVQQLLLDLGEDTPHEVEIAAAETAVAEETENFERQDAGMRTKGRRQKDNDQAAAIVASLTPETVLTDDQKAILAGYSGNGGGMVGADGKTGSPYEYYTPKPIAGAVWSLAEACGFSGGKVLDPSGGTGIFSATAPKSAVMHSIELDETSGTINKVLNASPRNEVTIGSFEAVAAVTPDETYDAVVTNVPFGEVAVRGANRFKDSRYQSNTLEQYFIMRSLELLKPNGIAVFISNTSIVSGKGAKSIKVRQRTSMLAEFVGAYRLPNKVFQAAHADVVTDVIVFRKHSRAMIEKIEDLLGSNPAILATANVMWEEFLEGKYFQGDGKKYVFGTTRQVQGRFGNIVEAVDANMTMGEMVKLMTKFPPSRIDWAALDSEPALPIVYNEGDCLYLGGRTLQMKSGEFVEVASARDADQEITGIGARMGTAQEALVNKVTAEEAGTYLEAMRNSSRLSQLPAWFLEAMQALPKGEAIGNWWQAVMVSAAISTLYSDNAYQQPYNYGEDFPEIHGAIPLAVKIAKRAPSNLGAALRDNFKLLQLTWNKKDGYSGRWTGSGNAEVEVGDRTVSERYEAAKYLWQDERGFIPLESLRLSMGTDFDPLKDDSFCIADDGKSAMSADDYFVGSYLEVVGPLRKQIELATDEAIKAKLAKQHDLAEGRVTRLDVSRLNFTVNTPFIELEAKLAYLNTYVENNFAIEFDADNEPRIMYQGTGQANPKTKKLRTRLASYVNKGTITLKGISEDLIDSRGETESAKSLLNELRSLCQQTDAQFNIWVKTNKPMLGGLQAKFNDPASLQFKRTENGDPLNIDGINEGFKFHGYQNSDIRRFSRRFEGINANDVGLGKTSVALGTVQFYHSTGIRKKTAFVVPNSVLSNWRKEAVTGGGVIGEKNYKAPVLSSGDDCLFVGMDYNDDGSMKSISSSAVDRDLNRILENKHRKIFMTYEAFEKIKVRKETLAAYNLSRGEVEDDSKRAEIIKEGQQAKLDSKVGQKSGAVPFLEDMGLDSLVVDEAHNFKNSEFGKLEGTGYKYISVAQPSQRGLDMNVKAWYIRGMNKHGDGVMSLTATPVTNSPLETYSMIVTSVGEDRAKKLLHINDGTDFLSAYCDFDFKGDYDIAGNYKDYKVFQGLRNIQLLSQALANVAMVRTGDAAGLVLPDKEEIEVDVDLSAESSQRLAFYRSIYLLAKAVKYKPDEVKPEQLKQLMGYVQSTGESVELLAHPFNFMQKMTNLIADPELDRQETVFLTGAQDEKAIKAVAAFNALNIKEDRLRSTPRQSKASELSTKSLVDDETGAVTLTTTVHVMAFFESDRVAIDSTDHKTQNRFIAIADKEALDLDCTVPPKIAAYISNYSLEESRPKMGAFAKQITFCDTLGIQNKVKILLSKMAGVPRSKIAVINAQAISDPAEMQDIQDGYNAFDEDNKYSAIVANKKAEFGQNYQKGTQAIHHLTIGWTPDSLHQRNGRGVRQGNDVSTVNVYHYDAAGTFDKYKRHLVGKKADWINALINPAADTEKVAITGGMSSDDYDRLINTIGADSETMRKAQEDADRNAVLRARDAVRGNQAQNLSIVKAQNSLLGQYANDSMKSLSDVMKQAISVWHALSKAKDARDKKGASAKVVEKAVVAVSNLEAQLTRIKETINSSVEFRVALVGSYDPLALSKTGKQSIADDLLGHFLWNGDSLIGRAKALENTDKAAWVFKDIKLKDDSEIIQSWQELVSSATAMRDQARVEFKRDSASEGAYQEQFLDRYESPSSLSMGGRIICDGDFAVRPDGKIGIVSTKGDGSYKFTDDPKATVSKIFPLTGVDTFGPSDPEYMEIAQRAAKQDDEMLRLLNANSALGLGHDLLSQNDPRLLSHTNDDIAQFVTESFVAWYSPNQSIRNMPFRNVVKPDDAEHSDVGALLFEKQKAFVEWNVEGTRFKLAAPDLDIQYAPYSFSAQQVAQWAIANAYALTQRDLNEIFSGNWPEKFYAATSSRFSYREGMNDTETVEEDFKSYVRGLVKPFLAVDVEPFVELMADKYANQFARVKAALVNAAAAKEIKESPPVGIPEIKVAAPKADGSQRVRVTGNTKPHKEKIKDYATRYGEQISPGRKYKWDGDNVCWVISSEAFAKLIQDYPDSGLIGTPE